jgi:hypothetical protein
MYSRMSSEYWYVTYRQASCPMFVQLCRCYQKVPSLHLYLLLTFVFIHFLVYLLPFLSITYKDAGAVPNFSKYHISWNDPSKFAVALCSVVLTFSHRGLRNAHVIFDVDKDEKHVHSRYSARDAM